MNTQSDIRSQLPQYLRQFVADQDYESRYSARDQAVWRYVMKQLATQLKESAHPVYFEGLAKTGISTEKIPSIDEMNVQLQRIGWRAIVVDGFIPPQAFMELQALKVLAIAQDMRSIHQINYTPAPDIIHEAAGHAPIIIDEEYSEYLQRFGQVGMKAMYNRWDLEMYEAVRQLSILKEGLVGQENTDQQATKIQLAEKQLEALLANPGKPSELAMLTRLHWWTVEYGLVGSAEKPTGYKLFGAGLLSSLGESKSCLERSVLKLPLTVEAVKTSYDITQTQPQLFVTKSCRHLSQILDEYAATMCYQQGGAGALKVAIESEVVTTCVYSSGLQVSGKLVRLECTVLGLESYLGTEGPTQLSVDGMELLEHGTSHHRSGFGSPVGRICNLMKPLEDATEYDLQSLDIRRESDVCLEFLSGIKVEGLLNSITKQEGKIVLLSFTNCLVSGPHGECLFAPSWGDYDMAVGDRIVSVFAGSADKSSFDVYPEKSRLNKTTLSHTKMDEREFEFYAQVRTLRNRWQENPPTDRAELTSLVDEALSHCPQAWLLHLELLELAQPDDALVEKLGNHLASLQKNYPEIRLISPCQPPSCPPATDKLQ